MSTYYVFNLLIHNNSMKQVLLLSLIYRCEIWIRDSNWLAWGHSASTNMAENPSHIRLGLNPLS